MPAVLAIIFNSQRNEVLLVKRRDVPIWVLPGGGVEPGETLEEALHREVLEETGLEVRIKRLAAIYNPLNRLTTITNVFECQYLSGSMQTSNETRDLRFFPIHGLPSDFFMIHHDFLNDALNSTGTLSKPLTQVTYFALLKYFFKHPLQVIRFALSLMGKPINS